MPRPDISPEARNELCQTAERILREVEPVKQWMLDNHVDPRDELWRSLLRIEAGARTLQALTRMVVERSPERRGSASRL